MNSKEKETHSKNDQQMLVVNGSVSLPNSNCNSIVEQSIQTSSKLVSNYTNRSSNENTESASNSNENYDAVFDGATQTTSKSIISNYTIQSSKGEAFNQLKKPSSVDSQAIAEIPLKRKKRIHIIQEQFFFPKEIQTDLSLEDVEFLFEYYKDSVNERETMLLKLASLVIDFDFFKENNKKTLFYTGLPSWSLLNNFYELIKDYLPSHYNCKLSRFQMTALILMKLRLNLSFTDIGYRFQVDVSTASRYFQRGIYILFKLFNGSKIVHWPERNNLLINTPSYFRSAFKERITIIIDCFELFVERSSVLKALAQSFSVYKHHATLKFLIGITITGVIIFVSIGFGGRTSDNEITLKSGFLDNLEEGDVVLADKGFKIEDEVEEKGAFLRLPCFVKGGNQLHPTEIEHTRHIANIRIHVERVISILRQKFNICSDMAEMSAVSKVNDLFNRDFYDKIIFVCSSLVNICPSVVKNDFEM